MFERFRVPTPSDLLADFLGTIRNGLIARGHASPNVGTDSDWHVLGSALVQSVAVGLSNAAVLADRQMPDTASGDDLIRIAAIFGLSPRSPVGASGALVLVTGSTVPPLGAECINAAGKRYTVTSRDLDVHAVTVQATDGGAATNLAAGAVLTWASPVAGMSPTATVGALGLTGGTDAEGTAAGGVTGLGARLYQRLRFPPAGGNWPQVAQWAEEASGAVQRAFVYPVLNGPGSLAVCVVAPCESYSDAFGWSRTVAAVELAKVADAVAGELPDFVKFVCFTPAAADHVAADCAIGVTLPLPAAAGGVPGGWLDNAPWPPANASGVHLGRCQVTTATSATDVTVRVEGSERPTADVTRIAWWSSSAKAFVVSTVHAFDDSLAPLVRLTLDPAAPLAGIAAGDMICPAAKNLDAYGLAFWGAVALLGPGEWTADADRLVRAARKPDAADAMPYALTATQLRAVSGAGSEVLDVAWLYRAAATPGAPSSTTTASPKILTPARIAFYPIAD